MNAQDYIFDKIQYLVDRFPTIQCRYEFDESTDSHYIEISPKTTLTKDESFIKEKYAITKEFVFEFPFETILFLAPDDVLTVDNPTRIREGVQFVPASLVELTTELQAMSDEHNYANDLEKIFDDHSGHYPTKLHQTIKEHEAISCNDSSCRLHSKPKKQRREIDIEKLIRRSVDTVAIGESDYALSA